MVQTKACKVKFKKDKSPYSSHDSAFHSLVRLLFDNGTSVKESAEGKFEVTVTAK